jgi:hypothetical protein
MTTTVAGGVVAWFWTRKPQNRAFVPPAIPYAGVVAESWNHSPAYGIGFQLALP